MPETTILVIDDEPQIRRVVRNALAEEGVRVIEAAGGREGIDAAAAERPDLVVLDLGLPDAAGISVCAEIRRWSSAPIVVLSARHSESDKVALLDAGADDYVTKPFSPAELMARVAAVLRRVRPALAGEQLACGDVEMDVTAHKVRRAGRPVALGPTEFRLLRHFMENPGRVFSRERLLDSVWGQDREIEARTVDVHIRRLRKAINADGEADPIRTVRSAGYSLDPEQG